MTDVKALTLPESTTPIVADGAQMNAPLTLLGALESLLFVSDKAVTLDQLAQTLDLSADVIEKALILLAEEYQESGRGLRLQEQNHRYRLVTAPEAATVIETFLNIDLSTRLTGPALETLAIIAYRQPATRAQVEALRGVDCGGVIRSLVQRGLLEEAGRLETVGRPILYTVTEQFMHHFGLVSMRELPPLAASESDLLLTTTNIHPEEPTTDDSPHSEGFAAASDSHSA